MVRAHSGVGCDAMIVLRWVGMVAIAPWVVFCSLEVFHYCVMQSTDLRGALWLAAWSGGVGLMGLLCPAGRDV